MLAWLDCVIEATRQADDHEMALCAIGDLAVGRAGAEPLLFFRGTYSRIANRTATVTGVAGLPPAW